MKLTKNTEPKIFISLLLVSPTLQLQQDHHVHTHYTTHQYHHPHHQHHRKLQSSSCKMSAEITCTTQLNQKTVDCKQLTVPFDQCGMEEFIFKFRFCNEHSILNKNNIIIFETSSIQINNLKEVYLNKGELESKTCRTKKESVMINTCKKDILTAEMIVKGNIQMKEEKNFCYLRKWYNASINRTVPTSTPIMYPTLSPTKNIISTLSPSISPTGLPSNEPSTSPSEVVSTHPSKLPSLTPTTRDTNLIPSNIPTQSLSTSSPIVYPSSVPSIYPISKPSTSPSLLPTISPSNIPTQSLSHFPSLPPSKLSTPSPSMSRSSVPSINITIKPSLSPSVFPTISPSNISTQSFSTSSLSVSPSIVPSIYPNVNPSTSQLVLPTISPSDTPTQSPSHQPTVSTSEPTSMPSRVSSFAPSMVRNDDPSSPPAETTVITESPAHESTVTPSSFLASFSFNTTLYISHSSRLLYDTELNQFETGIYNMLSTGGVCSTTHSKCSIGSDVECNSISVQKVNYVSQYFIKNGDNTSTKVLVVILKVILFHDENIDFDSMHVVTKGKQDCIAANSDVLLEKYTDNATSTIGSSIPPEGLNKSEKNTSNNTRRLLIFIPCLLLVLIATTVFVMFKYKTQRRLAQSDDCLVNDEDEEPPNLDIVKSNSNEFFIVVVDDFSCDKSSSASSFSQIVADENSILKGISTTTSDLLLKHVSSDESSQKGIHIDVKKRNKEPQTVGGILGGGNSSSTDPFSLYSYEPRDRDNDFEMIQMIMKDLRAGDPCKNRRNSSKENSKEQNPETETEIGIEYDSDSVNSLPIMTWGSDEMNTMMIEDTIPSTYSSSSSSYYFTR